ncbi:gamma-glutamyl-gamma-aminobutyrate hydrolase family protein [Metabacillus herbersteinensis]|uniref:Gamma-glutamyl-gamma-aminobutyrate hydrolase family protein n=1 Tax=Metabacillus herbersteinensis TaxID=283816 RepID=A0ABV6GIM6_9BACI
MEILTKSKPIIGITSSVVNHGEIPSAHLHEKYIASVTNAGGIPVVLPIGRDEEMVNTWVTMCDGFILSGGEDVDPNSYNANPEPELRKTRSDRDETELLLVKSAIDQQKPIFAICRGIAMLNAALGGTIIQDIETTIENPIKHYQTAARPDATHEISINEGSRLHNLIGSYKARVNSMHHQAVGDLAPDLVSVAVAPDGVIEAVEGKCSDSVVLGVQWHPEEMASEDESMHRLFVNLVEECQVSSVQLT